MSRSLNPKIMAVDSIYKPPTAICNAVFYASNNKSIGVAKAIDNMFRVVKDKIQNQTYYVKHMNKFCMFYGSVTEGLPPIFKIMLLARVAGKPF